MRHSGVTDICLRASSMLTEGAFESIPSGEALDFGRVMPKSSPFDVIMSPAHNLFQVYGEVGGTGQCVDFHTSIWCI